MFNVKQLRNDFPIYYHRPDMVYLDSAATSLKPISVINKEAEYYKKYSANIHRGIYHIAEKATEEYEETRKIVAMFIHAKCPEEIVFTKGATEALNLVAATLGEDIVEEGDEIVTTMMEHHSNFVTWQHLAFRTGGVFKIIDVNENFELAIQEKNKINLKDIITKKTRILAIGLVSNTLGTINPVKEIIKEAKKINPKIITVVDAAQAVPHLKVDVQDLGCDFLAFSSHKMLGPTGVGVLWGRYELLDQMPPYQFGGDMIKSVKVDSTEFNSVPHKFEAGTPNIAGVIALKEAIAYLQYYGLGAIRDHELDLMAYLMEGFHSHFRDDISFYGPKELESKTGVIAFAFKDIHPHDIAQLLDESNIAIRAGHHCTMPLHTFLKVPATARVSLYLYNDREDVDKLIDGLKKVVKTFAK